ncbi:unnamed protein product [Effrenium voratum]|nr:unnamed protein product [Effrenium voratum]
MDIEWRPTTTRKPDLRPWEAFPTQKYHNNVVVWDYRKEGVEEALRQCQRRLQRTLIDCVRVHDAESQERWQEACSGGARGYEA